MPRIATCLLTALLPFAAHAADSFLYVGNYDDGIYAFRFNTDSGEARPLGLVGKIKNPSFLATDGEYRDLYSVSELDAGRVAAFSVNRSTGALSELDSQATDGSLPCYVAIDAKAKLAFVANYGSGGLTVLPIESNGALGVRSQLLTAKGSSINRQRQEGPHAHEAVLSPDKRFVYVPDLGLDEIRIYKLDGSSHSISPANPAFAKVSPGNGPRHIALTSDGNFAYVVNELKPVVTVFRRDANTGALTQIQEVSSAPEGYSGENGQAEILLGKNDRFVYASDRGPGTIAVFAVKPGDGMLTRVQIAKTGGTMPRGVEMDPGGHFLLAGDQKLNKFVVFRVDAANGTLSPTGKSFEVPSPVSFVFIPGQ